MEKKKRRDFFGGYLMPIKRLFYGSQYGRAGQELRERQWAMCGMDNPSTFMPHAASCSPGGIVIPGVEGGNVMHGFFPPQPVYLAVGGEIYSEGNLGVWQINPYTGETIASNITSGGVAFGCGASTRGFFAGGWANDANNNLSYIILGATNNSGALQWRNQPFTFGKINALTVAKSGIYAGGYLSGYGHMWWYEKRDFNGNLLWSFPGSTEDPTNEGVVNSCCVDAADNFFIGGQDNGDGSPTRGTLQGYNKNGEMLFEIKSGSSSIQDLAIYGNHLYCQVYYGNLEKRDKTTGDLIASADVYIDTYNPMAVNKDGLYRAQDSYIEKYSHDLVYDSTSDFWFDSNITFKGAITKGNAVYFVGSKPGSTGGIIVKIENNAIVWQTDFTAGTLYCIG